MDTIDIIGWLHETFLMGPFVLWGRAMGASTALIVNHPLIVGKIADSSFTSLADVIKRAATEIELPSILYRLTVWALKRIVMEIAGFDFTKVRPIEAVKKKNNVPVRLCHAQDDELIPIEQAEALFTAYRNSDKLLARVEGGHNGTRPVDWIGMGCMFAMERLRIDTDGYTPVEFEGMQDIEEQLQSQREVSQFLEEQQARVEEVDPVEEG
jgi:fermentation-respiration switch protein FrsA (DUF1100 family)